jgi:hypothetical protein
LEHGPGDEAEPLPAPSAELEEHAKDTERELRQRDRSTRALVSMRTQRWMATWVCDG